MYVNKMSDRHLKVGLFNLRYFVIEHYKLVKISKKQLE